MKITIDFDESILKKMIKDTLLENNFMVRVPPMKLYTINQVAKKLGMAHPTIKRYVEKGLIKTTKNRKITVEMLNDYLNSEQKV